MKIPNSKAGKTTVTAALAAMLWAQLRKQGYENVSDFARRTGLVKKDGSSLMAFETVRRCFAEGERTPALYSLAIVMLYLEFPREFVKDFLRVEGDVLTCWLMGNTKAPQLRIWEEGLLEATNKIVTKNPDALAILGKQINMVGLQEGVDVSDAVAKMGHRPESARKRGPKPPAESE